MGFDYQPGLATHDSQRDGSKGFGGKFGVQTDRQDQSAGGYDDMEEVKPAGRTDTGPPSECSLARVTFKYLIFSFATRSQNWWNTSTV